MPIITAAIDPVTRIEGHLKIEVKIDTVRGVQQVVDAAAFGTLFRGFEKVLEGRDPRDSALITSRICGVCPTSHAQAAVNALDAACGVSAPDAGRILRNLVHGACFIESHILHFFLLSALDYIPGPAMLPWTPNWKPDRRIDEATAAVLLGHYVKAAEMRRKAHEMGAIFGGRLPHSPAYIGGGFTAVAKAAERDQFRAYLNELLAFITDVYLPDAELLASLYPDYFDIGCGYGNLLAYGVFELNAAGTSKLLRPGRLPRGTATALAADAGAITESVTHSWYAEGTNNQNPAAGATLAQHPKDGAYSWLKAPRYGGVPYEVGPLARMAVNGDYANGVSVMDRHLARAREALKIAQAMQGWLDQLPVGVSGYAPCAVPASATSMGWTEAPRGALGHWLRIAGGVVQNYQIITPTCWNCSPRDTAEQRGPLEEALVGTPVANADEPVEVLRVIHSFDPCLDCATHVSRPGEKARIFAPANPRCGWPRPEKPGAAP
jgi:hydrogenase large subunit